jgi:hypothetical protein
MDAPMMWRPQHLGIDQRRAVMNRSLALAVALLGLGTTVSAANAVAATTLKDQLVGPRTLVFSDEMNPDGTKIPKSPSNDRWNMTGQKAERRFEVAQRRCPNGRC